MTSSKICMGNQRERVTCTPAIWWAMDEGSQWRLYKLRSPRILALIVFLEFATAMHSGEFGEVIRLNDTNLLLSSSSSSSVTDGGFGSGVDG